MEQSYLSWHLTSLLQYGACRHKVKKIIFQIQKVHYLDQKVNNAQNKAEVESLVKKYILSNDSLNPDDLVVSEFITLLRNRF